MAESTTNSVSEYRDYDDVDPILPDDFNPEDENYDYFSDPSDTTEEEAPTTEQTTEEQPIEEEASEPVVETEEPTTTQETTPQDESVTNALQQELEAVKPPQTIKVKFNHEEREIPLDEAAVLSQKGLNYDKVEQQRKELEAKLSRAELLARRLGYQTTDEMYEAAENNFVETRVKDLVDAGNSEAIARFLVKQEMAEAAKSVQVAEPEQTEEQPTPQPPQSLMSSERQAELREFVKAYPGITNLPEEVIKENANGTRLIVAYERFMNKAALNKATSELAILRQNQAAADKAPVTGLAGKSAAGVQNQKVDPFIAGFDSDDW